LRALRIIQRLLGGARMPEVAQEMGRTVTTLKKELRWAERQGLMDDLKDKVLSALAPVALERVREAITSEGNTDAALEVLKGIGLLRKHAVIKDEPASGEDELEVYLRARRARLVGEPVDGT
jgi:hypothetical protein